MARRYGIDVIKSIVECPETNFEKAFYECTGEDFPTFYKEWRIHVILTAEKPQNPLPILAMHRIFNH